MVCATVGSLRLNEVQQRLVPWKVFFKVSCYYIIRNKNTLFNIAKLHSVYSF